MSIKVAGKNAKQSALRTIEKLFTLFAKGGDELKQFLDDLRKTIVDWFLSNKKKFINRAYVGNKLLNKIKAINGLTITFENGIYTFKYFDVLIKSGNKLQVETTVNKLFLRGEKAAIKKLNLLVYGSRIPRFAKEFLAHLKQGHLTIAIQDLSQTPIKVIEKYKYILGKGGRQQLVHPYQAKVIKVGGVHIQRYVNTTNRRIKEVKDIFKLPNGDEVIKAKIEVFVKEQAGWKVKSSGLSTFFPKNWSDYKIERTIKEAMDNIYFKSKNRFKGKAKDGTKIEFYYSKTKKGTNTAYIIK